MMMENNRELVISEGRSRKETDWKPVRLLWSELVEQLRIPKRGTETLEEYKALPKARRDELKDVGGFVGGTLSGPRRKKGSVVNRCLVALDMDHIPPRRHGRHLKTGGRSGVCLRRLFDQEP